MLFGGERETAGGRITASPTRPASRRAVRRPRWKLPAAKALLAGGKPASMRGHCHPSGCQVPAAAGYSHVFVHKCETGEPRVDVAEFMDWCAACNVDPSNGFERSRALCGGSEIRPCSGSGASASGGSAPAGGNPRQRPKKGVITAVPAFAVAGIGARVGH